LSTLPRVVSNILSYTVRNKSEDFNQTTNRSRESNLTFEWNNFLRLYLPHSRALDY